MGYVMYCVVFLVGDDVGDLGGVVVVVFVVDVLDDFFVLI